MSTQFNRIGVLANHELAAFAAYQEALNLTSIYLQDELREIQNDHVGSAHMLKSASLFDCTMDTEPGGWEIMNKALHHVEKLYGKQAALQTLHDCEELSISDYEDCLRDNSIPYKGRTIILNRLIPQARDHIKRLDQLMHLSHQQSRAASDEVVEL